MKNNIVEKSIRLSSDEIDAIDKLKRNYKFGSIGELADRAVNLYRYFALMIRCYKSSEFVIVYKLDQKIENSLAQFSELFFDFEPYYKASEDNRYGMKRGSPKKFKILKENAERLEALSKELDMAEAQILRRSFSLVVLLEKYISSSSCVEYDIEEHERVTIIRDLGTFFKSPSNSLSNEEAYKIFKKVSEEFSDHLGKGDLNKLSDILSAGRRKLQNPYDFLDKRDFYRKGDFLYMGLRKRSDYLFSPSLLLNPILVSVSKFRGDVKIDLVSYRNKYGYNDYDELINKIKEESKLDFTCKNLSSLFDQNEVIYGIIERVKKKENSVS